MKTHTIFRAVLTATVALFVLFCSSVSTASVVLNSPDLPPESDPPNCSELVSQYEGIDLQALYPGGLELSDTIYRCFTSVVRVTDPGTGDETELFDATVEGIFDNGTSSQRVVLTGPMTVVVRGKNNAESGSWDTEIISMNLTGDVGGIPRSKSGRVLLLGPLVIPLSRISGAGDGKSTASSMCTPRSP